MVLALLLQIATLLPPAPVFEAKPDAAYRASVQQLASAEDWTKEALENLAPAGATHDSALAEILHDGTDSEVRIAAILGAGCSEDSKLAKAFWRRAALEQEEAKTIACLLAPAFVSPDAYVLLAWLATDPQKSLPIRATALARLLDADQVQVWPMVRSILRAGTAEDVVAPGADWKRGGRYELPKRILLLSIQALLKRNELESTSFEPNAAWRAQLDQLISLENQIAQLAIPKIGKSTVQSEAWRNLLVLIKQKSAHAELAHALLIH